MRYEFDEEKIKREGLYDLEDMKRIIDDAAKHFHLTTDIIKRNKERGKGVWA